MFLWEVNSNVFAPHFVMQRCEIKFAQYVNGVSHDQVKLMAAILLVWSL